MHLLKKIALFFTVFFFLYPVFPKLSPIPLDRILQIIGFGLFLAQYKDRATLFHSKRFYRFCGLTLILLFLGLIGIFQSDYNGYDFYFVKMVFDTFLCFFSAYLIYWLARKCYPVVNIGIIIHYIVLCAVIQTIICSVFFLNPQLLNSYMSLLNQDTNQGIISRLDAIKIRFIGFGSQFFSGAIKYGIATFSVLILPYTYKSWLTSNKLIYFCCLLLILIGGVFTARTCFIGIGLGVIMILALHLNSIISFVKINIKIISIIILSLSILLVLAKLILTPVRFEAAYNFVFEVFINYFSGNGAHSGSSNKLIAMYNVFPHSQKTWLLGDGRMQDPLGGYYKHIDVGFLRLIFYFGLPFTCLFTYILYRYNKIIQPLIVERPLKYYIFFISIWLIVLNIKGLAFDSYYFVLILVFAIFSNRNAYLFVLPENDK